MRTKKVNKGITEIGASYGLPSLTAIQWNKLAVAPL